MKHIKQSKDTTNILLLSDYECMVIKASLWNARGFVGIEEDEQDAVSF